jgi:hypothetical protein
MDDSGLYMFKGFYAPCDSCDIHTAQNLQSMTNWIEVVILLSCYVLIVAIRCLYAMS